jgi:hypothetical protein
MVKKTDETDDVVQTTVRLRRTDWERLATLSIKERRSIQGLTIEAFNLLFKNRKLPEMKSPKSKK